jgi:DNA-binding beta-propeller fold protein YncE
VGAGPGHRREAHASFETGIGPHEVEISPDGRLAVVSNYGERERPGNSLTVVDWPGRREVARVVDLGEDTRPHGMAFLPDGRLVVTTEGSDRLLVVDVAGEVLQRIEVGEGVAHMVAASPDGRFAWVTNISAGTLEKVDLEAGEVTGTIKTGPAPRAWASRTRDARSGSPTVPTTPSASWTPTAWKSWPRWIRWASRSGSP